jgi:hypothetical protein
MSDPSAASTNDPVRGLPVVQPPSGKFIAQLFLVPLVIVSVLVGFTLFIRWWAGSARSPGDYLAKLDDGNPDVRWRGAEDLAQTLLRDDHLASDPRFGLELAERLRQALKANIAQEKALGEPTRQGARPERDRDNSVLEPERDRLLYLSACLGDLVLPVGAPVLSDMAIAQDGGDAKFVAQRRLRALWSLVSLGKNVQRFDALSESRRQQVFTMLEEEAAAGNTERRELAQKCLDYMRGSHKGSLELLGIEQAFTRCGEDQNPFLRSVTALGLNFWEGTPAESQRMNALLARLDRDNGRGEDILDRYREEDKQEQMPVTKTPGLTISFNATVALARRGSELVRLGVLRRMLDRSYLAENLLIRSKDGHEEPDVSLVSKTIEAALQAIADLHRKHPERDLATLYPAIEEVARNSDTGLRIEAERTLKALRTR